MGVVVGFGPLGIISGLVGSVLSIGVVGLVAVTAVVASPVVAISLGPTRRAFSIMALVARRSGLGP